MDPEILLQAVYTMLHRTPPAGLDPDDVDGFFDRNRVGLLQAIRQAFPTATIEPAFTRFREEHRLARLVLEATRRHLEARGGELVGRELAELLEALDDHVAYENRVLFPYLRGQLPALAPALDHAREEHEVISEHLFALVAALRAGRRYEGPAIEAAIHHFDEEERDILGPAIDAGLARTPAGAPGRLIAFAVDIERLAASLAPNPSPVAGEPTRWGGRRGGVLAPSTINQGTRVVTAQGEHGIVTEAHAIVFASLVGSRRSDDDVHYAFTLRLDSGRLASPRGPLYEELAWPEAVVPDIQVGDRWLAASEVWSQAYSRYRDISNYAEKAENARKPENKRQWLRHGEQARKEFLELHRLIVAWRWAHPDEPIEGLREHLWRRLGLEAKEQRTEDESWELAQLKRLPSDWDTRFKVGDRVLLYVLGPYGRQPEPGWTIAEISGQQAILSRDEQQRARAEPLWLLKPDDSASLVETFTEPRYLRELASDMLVQEGHHKPYPNRGAVARAVKSFLAENGVEVSTRVGQGSMVTGIDLSPPDGRWEPDTIARMRRLLPGINVWNSQQASLEPWETTGDKSTYQGDYTGKSAGLLIPVEHLPRFAVILASAMKADGQQLNALGERRLAAAQVRAPSTPSGSRGGATADQRVAAAVGCRDLEFDLPGYGHIRVVCGQEGRRDVWHNCYVAGVRHGFNGGRWAHGQRPPEPVLIAIRERGVAAFS